MPRPKNPGTLAEYKRSHPNVDAVAAPVQWRALMDAYEESRMPSRDPQYFTDDGTPLVLVDDSVNPRTLKWFTIVLEDAGLYSANNSQGMSDADVRTLWKTRTEAFKSRPGRQTREYGLVNNNSGWDEKDRTLTQAQKDRLVDVYYRDAKASYGLTALWHELDERTDPTQPADRMGLSYRDVRQWYSDQMIPALRRNQPKMSKSKSRMPMLGTFRQLKYMQLDLMDLKGLPDRDRKYIWNLVDESTRYSVQDALKDKTAATCATVFIEFMLTIKERYGRWPHAKSVLRVDNGKEFAKKFEAACIRGIDAVFADADDRFELIVKRGASNVANDQALVELTNAQWRSTCKTFLYTTQQPMNAWYGFLPQAQGGWGINMRHVNSLLNSRKQASLGNQDATTVWDACWSLTANTNTEADTEIVDAAFEAQKKRALARRGPSAATTKPYTVGQDVRKFNMRWKKASLKSNKQKMDLTYKWGGPEDVYVVTRVRGGVDTPADYKLVDSDDVEVAERVPHDQLLPVGKEETPPAEVLDERDYELETQVDDREYYRSYPWAET